MKNLFVCVCIGLIYLLPSFVHAEVTQRGKISFRSYGRKGDIRSVRRRDGETGSKNYCFPVGNCHDHYGYYNAQHFQEDNPYYKGDHLGEDWNANTGGDTDLGHPVYAMGAGMVLYSGDAGPGWGNCIMMMHETIYSGKYTISFYGHLQKRLVNESAIVALHQKVGTIGKGYKNEYLAHLHFAALEISKSTKFGMKDIKGYAKGKNTDKAYINPTTFISSKLPPKFKTRPTQMCVGKHKKMGGVYKCTQTAAQGGIVGEGETISPLVTIDNVWIHHMFEVDVSFNGKHLFYQVSDLKLVDDEYGWSVSQGMAEITNTVEGMYSFDFYLREIRLDKTKGKKTKIGSAFYSVQFAPKSVDPKIDSPFMSKNIYLLNKSEVCKEFTGGKSTEWLYSCNYANDYYQEGDSFYILTGIQDVKINHRFKTVAKLDGKYQWEQLTMMNNVSKDGWKYSFTWPHLTNAKPGSWKFEVFIGKEDGTFSPLVKKYIVVLPKPAGQSKVEKKENQTKVPDTSDNSSGTSTKKTSTNTSSTSSNKSSTSTQTEKSGSTNQSGNQSNNSSSSSNQSSSSQTQKKTEKKVMAPYKYVNTKVCSSVSAPNAQWHYFCVGQKNAFPSTTKKVHILSKITNVWVKHKFSIQVFKDNMFQWSWTSDQNNVNESTGWSHAYFFPYLSNLTPGNWRALITIKHSNKEETLDSVKFTIESPMSSTKKVGTSQGNTQSSKNYSSNSSNSSNSSQSNSSSNQTPNQSKVPSSSNSSSEKKSNQSTPPKDNNPKPLPRYIPAPKEVYNGVPYKFSHMKVCTSVMSYLGDKYDCIKELYSHKVGAGLQVLVKFTDVYKTHRFKLVASSGSNSWQYVTNWNTVNSKWKYSYFYPKHANLKKGNWFYKVYIQVQGGQFKLVGAKNVFVY